MEQIGFIGMGIMGRPMAANLLKAGYPVTVHTRTKSKAAEVLAAGSHSLKVLGAKVVAGDFKPAFMVDLQLKDLRLVMEMAEQVGQPLPGTALVKQLLASLQAKGRGKDGTQALFEVLTGLSA